MNATKTHQTDVTIYNKYTIWKKGPKFLNLAPPFEIPWQRNSSQTSLK